MSLAILDTADQRDVEDIALSLRSEPALVAAREEALARHRATPWCQHADGRNTVQDAVDELLYGVLLVAASDPADPKIVWGVTLPREVAGRRLPGSRYGGDSPDRIYRGVAINPGFRYEIHGHQCDDVSRRPIAFSIEALPEPIFWGLPPLAVLTSDNIDFAHDGSFTITADATPSDGRRNHVQLPPGAAMLFIRDTIPDWADQVANALTIRRVDGSQATRRQREDMIRQAVHLLDSAVTVALGFYATLWKKPPNRLLPYVRDLGWGMLASNSFSLANDEALIVTLAPETARYLSLQSMDFWMRSVPYDQYQSSLHNAQAEPNADGTYTFVVAPRDPGVCNWIDTAYNDGLIVARWELLSGQPDPDKAVREIRQLPLADVAAAVPGMTRITATQRREQMENRLSAYLTRLR